MYTTRPILIHFVPWLILLPVIIIEGLAFKGFHSQYLLDNLTHTNKVVAEITGHREWHDNIMEIRYRFQVEDDQTWYSASDAMTGKKNLWMPITELEWQDIVRRGQLVDVLYLQNNPWINKPVNQTGIPVWDSLCLWSLLFAIDAYSIYEFIIMIRNYLHCQRAAERGELCRLKYWKSQPF